jgi:transcriptional regulator with PAS, ATPase and Fis domain
VLVESSRKIVSSEIISSPGIGQKERLLENIKGPALLITEQRQPIFLNDAAKSVLDQYDQDTFFRAVLPEVAEWENNWQRISQGHTVTTSVDLSPESIPGNSATRIDLTFSLLSDRNPPCALCILGSFSQDHGFTEIINQSKFPDENPNPVMRFSKDGRLLYANRSSASILGCWNLKLGGRLKGTAWSVLSDVIRQGSQRNEDFPCGDRVYTVTFAPLSDDEFVNVYVLDTTEIMKAKLALQTALGEVRELKNRLQQENKYLQEEIKQELGSDVIIGDSDAQSDLMRKVGQVARTDATVLISGETGTGKELIARAIHAGSQRKDRPLVKVNCAALPANLIESELFGHEKGAFTGASARKIGRFELADAGTIFLDEIGDLPLELQAKLLRVLQEGELERVGGIQTIRIDVRIIAATNRSLANSIAAGEFRDDLFYRLNVFPIESPPLRNRKKDIPLLANHFVQKYSVKIGKLINSIEAPLMAQLQAYDWPGNVRELENIIERAIILSDGDTLQLDEAFDLSINPKSLHAPKTIREVEKEMIQVALEDCDWKIEGQCGAATRLDMAPSTLRERIKKFGIQRPAGSKVINIQPA